MKSLSPEDSEQKFITVSCAENFERCREMMLAAVDRRNVSDVSHRIWRIESKRLEGWKYSTMLLLEKGGDLIDSATIDGNDNRPKRVDDALIAFGDVFIMEIQGDDGKWLVDEKLVPGTEGVPKSEGNAKNAGPLFSPGTDFFSKLGSSTSQKVNGNSSSLKPAANITGASSSTSTSSNAIKLKFGGRKNAGSTVGLQNMCVIVSMLL